MSSQIYLKSSIKHFVEELGNLLSIRISQYLHKYKNGSEANFINQLIMCPHFEDYDIDYIHYPALTRKHFEENLNIDLTYFELNQLHLKSDMKVEYSFSCYPYFIEDEIEANALEFALVANQITFYDQDMINFLETYGDDVWNKLTQELRKEISFGTLKNS